MLENRMNDGLIQSEDGRLRCWWHGNDAEYLRYHDEEWGRPVSDDVRLFEKCCLEGFQAGLSWLTILRKRENFRRAFVGFDFEKVALFTQGDVERLLGDAGIIRHRGKIEATINNATRAIEVIEECGSLAAYFWRFEPASRAFVASKENIPAVTDSSKALSKDLKQRGFKFVGPTTMYALMQAMGMVNDHLIGCCVHSEIEQLRADFIRPQCR